MKMKKAKFIPFILTTILTINSFIVLIKVLNGNIGNGETWRIIFSIVGFLIFLLFLIFSTFRIFIKKV